MKVIKSIMKKEFLFPLLILFGYLILHFLLKNKFLFTPDFGGSDAVNNIPYKYFLWKSFRSGIFPFWTDLLNGGYPFLAESQAGLLYLPYYLIFPFFSSLSSLTAFLLLFHIFLLNIGMYFLLRHFKISVLLAFLLSIIFAWNGSITFRWVHSSVLQSFSYVPFLYLVYFKWKETSKKRYLLIISLIINQMVFAGFVQCVFIAALGLSILFLIQNFPLKKVKTTLFFCALIFGILLSLPQIVPTVQLSQFSDRTDSNFYDFAVSVPFTINNICSFYSSTCFGTAKNASYPTNWQEFGTYWENTPYIGEIFVILLTISSLYFFTKRKKNKSPMIFLVLFGIFLLLALGKNSPLYFLFAIFPFSLFRTPGRYLLLANFFLILYAGLVLKSFIKKKRFITIPTYICLGVNCIILINTTLGYHLFVNSPQLYSSFASQKIVKTDALYITQGIGEEWNKSFLKVGWSTKQSINEYLFLTRALLGNTNLYSGQKSFDSYASLPIRRQQYIKQLIFSELQASKSGKLEAYLKLYNIGTIISLQSIDVQNFTRNQILKNGSSVISTYQNASILNSALYYIPHTISKVQTIDEIDEKMQSGDISQDSSVAEVLPSTIVTNTVIPKVIISLKNDQQLQMKISTDKNVFIVLKKNWYPEWKLTIDGKDTTTYKTNLIHMGFFVPKGSHTVKLTYVPTSFYLGCLLSFISIGIVAIFFLKARKRSF